MTTESSGVPTPESGAYERTTATVRAAGWIAVVLIVGALLGLWLLGTPLDRHTQLIDSDVPAWVTAASDRHPCPAGERRAYEQSRPGLWKSWCVRD